MDNEILRIDAAEGWRQVYLSVKGDPIDDRAPSGHGVHYTYIEEWVLYHDVAQGMVLTAGVTRGDLIDPELVASFVGYLAPGADIAVLDNEIREHAGEVEIIGVPWDEQS